MKNLLYCALSALVVFTCSSRKSFDHEHFAVGVSHGAIDNKEINEASGLAASVNNPGMFWTHNDSGDKARIFLIDGRGKYQAMVSLGSLINRDWEDIAVGPGPEQDRIYLYVGEIGDNLGLFTHKYIYRIPEPTIKVDNTSSVKIDTTVNSIDSIKFMLPDGPRDTEAIMIDPLTKDIYIFSKREEKQVNMYVLPFPQSTVDVITAKFVMHIPFTKIVAADMSKDGTEVLLKNYTRVYYWKKKAGESVEDMLKREPYHLPYITEPQGEAIAFDREGRGYYTLSEEAKQKRPHLMFYKRKGTDETE